MTPQRIQLSRTKGWRMPAGAKKVDRSTRWGNPWAVGCPGIFHGNFDGLRFSKEVGRDLTAEDAVDAFACWLIGYAIPKDLRPQGLTAEGNRLLWPSLALGRQTIRQNLDELRGRDLACWCKPGKTCHADILIAIANCDRCDLHDTLQSLRRT